VVVPRKYVSILSRGGDGSHHEVDNNFLFFLEEGKGHNQPMQPSESDDHRIHIHTYIQARTATKSTS
jgi:hypothetical protein